MSKHLHVLPASPLLEQAERELQGTAGAPYRLADPLAKIAAHYAAVVIDTRPSFSLLTEMALVASTDALVPVEPRYLETVGLLSVMKKINEVREGWRIPQLRVSGLVVTKMDKRVRGHCHLLDELKAHPTLGKRLHLLTFFTLSRCILPVMTCTPEKLGLQSVIMNRFHIYEQHRLNTDFLECAGVP